MCINIIKDTKILMDEHIRLKHMPKLFIYDILLMCNLLFFSRRARDGCATQHGPMAGVNSDLVS